MEDSLDINNILGASEVESLFTDNDPEPEPVEGIVSASGDTGTALENKDANKEANKETTEVQNVEDLFSPEEPESVGSGKDDTKGQEDTTQKGSGTSPNNFYSSIAKALKEEGIFPDLDNDDFNSIKAPEDFRDLIEKQIKAGLDERQKRIDEALGVGVEPSEIKKYENTIGFLYSIKPENLSDEGDKGEGLRKNLIYQDFINRGYSKERALREVQKSLNAGTDIDDAKEALKGNIEFFKEKYDSLVKDAKQEEEEYKNEMKKQAEDLKSSIFSDDKVFGDLVIDQNTRKKIYDNIAKPVYRDPETGEYLTAIQKYELEHRTEFLKNLGLIFTLTNGFKSLDSLVKGKVRKEVSKGLKELENTLNNTVRTSDGNLQFISGVSEDPESFIGKGWNLDI